MTLTARATSTATLLRRRRDGRPARTADSPARTRAREADAVPTITAARMRRRSDVPQDHALYTCSCGFVFEAEVSTSVGCPHCGVAQAW